MRPVLHIVVYCRRLGNKKPLPKEGRAGVVEWAKCLDVGQKVQFRIYSGQLSRKKVMGVYVELRVLQQSYDVLPLAFPELHEDSEVRFVTDGGYRLDRFFVIQFPPVFP